ncbi:MAG TPA: ABC transporter substrate-binding protein [Candidatus Acidoferrales bacterium]|nr:ABC transporter substrate-binding protein [Candidatus Acidoferrales bacterium]
MSNNSNKKISLSILVIAIILVAAGAVYYFQTMQAPVSTSQMASTSSSTQPQVPYNQTIVEDGNQGEPSGLDIAWSTDEPAWEITQSNLYQDLVFYRGNSTTVFDPILATSWTISPDARDYTFDLRQGVRFSDGQPFNAYDVWFNYYRITLNNGPPGYLLGTAIFNAGSVTLNDLNTFNFTSPTQAQLAVMQNANQSIQVIDQYTIAFHFSAPHREFIPRLASPAGGIEDPNFVQIHGGVQGNGTANDYVEQHSAPGTGPYILQSWTRGQRITLTLNPYYWGPTPHISTVIYQFKTNMVDALNDLRSGGAQLMYTVPFNLLPDIQGTPGITLENTGLSLDIFWISINTRAPPLNNAMVRQAINYAINKQAIIDGIIHGYGVTFQGPLPRTMFGYNDSIQPYGFDLNMSKQLLAQAGYPGGKGIRPLSLLYFTGDPVAQAVVQAVQSDLAQVGITVNLQVVTQPTYFSIVATIPRVSNYPDMVYTIWFPDYAYPDDYAYAFENSASVFDNTNYNDSSLNMWTNQALNTGNTTLQQHLYSLVTQRDKDLAGNIWLFQTKIGNGVPAYVSTVQNVTWNPIQYGFKFAPLYISPAGTAQVIGNTWLTTIQTVPTETTIKKL